MTTLYAHGNRLLLDGKPFFPKGFNSVAGHHALPMCGGRSGKAAFEQFTAPGSPTCTAMRRDWHANIVRLQVVQNALADPGAAPAYIGQLQQLVSVAEAAGLCVILCMQDSLPPPCGSSTPANAVINDKTAAAWSGSGAGVRATTRRSCTSCTTRSLWRRRSGASGRRRTSGWSTSFGRWRRTSYWPAAVTRT